MWTLSLIMKKYIDRLYKEWMTHGKIIIGTDFDSTISPWNTLDNEDDIKRTIKLIKDCQNVGCYLIVHTACNPERYDEIRQYCKKIGIPVDAINENAIKLPYGNGTKPYCNIFLDDRAGLVQALDILEEAMVFTRAYNYEKNQTGFDI